MPRVPWRYFAVPCLPVIPCGVIYCESLREARFCVILCLNVIDILLRVFFVTAFDSKLTKHRAFLINGPPGRENFASES